MIAGMRERFRAGFGLRTITPPLGSEMPGGLQKNFHRERHDPLYTTAVLFNDGHSPIMIVGANAFGIPRSIALWVRNRLADRLGIPVSGLLTAADHGHNCGPIMDFMLGEADPAYQSFFAHHMVEAGVAAYRHQRRSTLRSAHEPVPDGIFFNRRMRMKKGGVLTHPVRLKLANRDEIDAPDGPVDNNIRMVFVHDALEPTRLLGTLVNVACHNATRPGGYTKTSADYAGKLREMIPKRLGAPRSRVLFLSGACGDVTHVDNLGNQPERSGDHELIATAVTDAVQRGSAHATPIPHPRLESRTQTIQLPRRDPFDPQLRHTQDFGDEQIWEREQRLYHDLYKHEPSITTEVQALGIGNEVGIAALPGEFFAEHGLQLQQSSPFPDTWVVTQANDAIGYAPPERTHPFGYEWRTARSSQLAKTGGDDLVNAVEKLLQDVHS